MHDEDEDDEPKGKFEQLADGAINALVVISVIFLTVGLIGKCAGPARADDRPYYGRPHVPYDYYRPNYEAMSDIIITHILDDPYPEVIIIIPYTEDVSTCAESNELLQALRDLADQRIRENPSARTRATYAPAYAAIDQARCPE